VCSSDLDGSAYAPSLYQHTAWAAARLSATVEVLHVYPPAIPFFLPPVNFMGDPGMGSTTFALPELSALSEAQEKEARTAAMALLEEASQAVRAAGLRDVERSAVPGLLPDVLTDWDKPIDLLLMGKRGESTAPNRDALGSQLETVIRHSKSPVLVVSHKFQPISRFLVSFDDSPSSHAALRYVIESPLLRGLPCDLVMAGDPTPENHQALDSARAILGTGGFEPQEFLMQGDPETVSAWEVTANQIDLLVMGAYSHSRFLQFFIGSTTSEIIRRCRIPVLVMGGKMPHLDHEAT
jgi:nucleotide-binding universal stress UspA family protein